MREYKMREYENWWRYKDNPFYSEDIQNYYGFVYKITHTESDHFYIGSKYFYHKKYYFRSSKKIQNNIESDWKEYYGSSIPFKRFIQCCGKNLFERKILKLCSSKEELYYQEARYQFQYDVLNNKYSFNNNIGGVFYPYSGIYEYII